MTNIIGRDVLQKKMYECRDALEKINSIVSKMVGCYNERERLERGKRNLSSKDTATNLFFSVVTGLFLGSTIFFFDLHITDSVFFFVILFFMFVMISYPIYNWFLKNRNEERIKPFIYEIENDIETLNKALYNTHEKYTEEINFIPPYYQSLISADYMFHAIANGKADSIKEAMLLFDEQAHRWNMESAQQTLINELNHQRNMIRQVHSSANAAAGAASAAALMSGLSLIRRL